MLKAQERIFERHGVYVLPCWVENEFTEAVGTPGQVVPKRPADLPASPISRSDTNHAVNVERVDEFGPTDADEDVVRQQS